MTAAGQAAQASGCPRRLERVPRAVVISPISMSITLWTLAGLHLDDQTTDLFLHGNAERVFGLTP